MLTAAVQAPEEKTLLRAVVDIFNGCPVQLIKSASFNKSRTFFIFIFRIPLFTFVDNVHSQRRTAATPSRREYPNGFSSPFLGE